MRAQERCQWVACIQESRAYVNNSAIRRAIEGCARQFLPRLRSSSTDNGIHIKIEEENEEKHPHSM
jgi:hypothetical protein